MLRVCVIIKSLNDGIQLGGFMETKISSMWDKIFECTIPINKISMIVAFSKGEEFVSPSGAGQKKTEHTADGVKTYIDVSMPPPDMLIDYRGRRSFYHIVIGFAHRKNGVTCNSKGSKAVKKSRSIGGENAANNLISKKKAYNTSTWFVLRQDGEILMLNNRCMNEKLKNMDLAYLKDIKEGYSNGVADSDWIKKAL